MLQNENYFHLNNYDDNNGNDKAGDRENANTYDMSCKGNGKPLCVPYSIHYDELLYKEF